MNILFITSYFPPLAGGSAVVYENICRHIPENVAVLTTWRHYMDGNEINDWKKTDKNYPFYVKRVELLRPVVRQAPANMLVSVKRLLCEDLPLKRRTAKAVLRLIDEKQIDLVCLGELYALSWMGEFIKKKRGLPFIHYIHGEEITAPSGSRFYGRGAMKTLRNCDGVIAVSTFTKRELQKKQVPEDSIHLIPNGVDTRRFFPGEKKREIIETYHLENKKILMTIARVEERKGHDKVIEALPRLLAHHSDILYMVVGEGSYLNHLKHMVSEKKLQEHVIFTGKVPWSQLTDFYRTCDVFVMPNRTLANGDTEGFGLVFLEAGACEKPVIGGNAGGVPDAVAHGLTGMLVDGTSTSQIAEAIEILLGDEVRAKTMGKEGRKRAEAFSWDNKAIEFLHVCRTICDHSKGMKIKKQTNSAT